MTAAEGNDTTRLEQAFSADETGFAPESCPSDDELWASAAGELTSTANEKIVLHLARCNECSSTWRLAREILPADHLSRPSVVSIDARRQPKPWRRIVLPAAAAAILIGLGLSTGLFVRNDPSSTPVFRQQGSDYKILPSSETRTLPRSACDLRWSAGPDGSRYDLIVSDGELEILSSVKGLEEPDYTVPQEMISASTVELFWRVIARLPDGSSVSSATFTTIIDDGEETPG